MNEQQRRKISPCSPNAVVLVPAPANWGWLRCGHTLTPTASAVLGAVTASISAGEARARVGLQAPQQTRQRYSLKAQNHHQPSPEMQKNPQHLHGSGSSGTSFVSLDPSSMLLGQLRALPTHLQQDRGSEGAATADPTSPARRCLPLSLAAVPLTWPQP